MVYILELKTTQAAAMKIVTDAINSLLNDANFDFYPYYIEDSTDTKTDDNNGDKNSDANSDYESESEDEESDNGSDSGSDSEQYIKNKITKKNSKGEKNKKEDKTSATNATEGEVEKKKTIGGVVLKEVNKTGKILVYMRLDADKFDIYKYNYHKKKLTLGIDIGNLLKCLKCMSHFDTMSWLVDDDDINKLIVVLESVERKEKKTFKLNLMDIEEETYDIKPIQFP